MAAWPAREGSTGRLVAERARTRRALSVHSTAGGWKSMGPTDVGGRVTCAISVPTRPDVLLVGSAGGGVWRSEDAGLHWKSLWHRQASLNVGALALDPADARIVYAGTGEANLSTDSYPGVGLFRSDDAGDTWTSIANATRGDVPIRIGAIAIDPFDRDHILVGGVGHHFAGEFPVAYRGGLHVTRDGAVTWSRSDLLSGDYWCHAVRFHPTRRDRVYAYVTEQGSRNGLWRSDDGGATWSALRSGLPPPDRCHRAALAIAPSAPDTLVLQIADAVGHGDKLLGIFRSTNGGDAWRSIGGAHFAGEKQMSYNNAISVHPTNPDHVLCGGVELHRTVDGGAHWKKVSKWDADVGKPNYAHSDQHAILMPGGGLVYALNDGGLDVSEDGGLKWTNRSRGLVVTMFYDYDICQADERVRGGGAQDNGTPVTVTGDPGENVDVTTGDGGWLAFDPTDAGHLIASIYNLTLFRFRTNDGWKEISPPATEAERNAVWMAYVEMDSSDPRRIYTGSTRVWRTKDDGGTWRAVSTDLDGGVITAIESTIADPRTVYVGTEKGGVFASSNAGDSWSGDLRSGVLPGRMVTRILTRPTSARDVFVTVANFGTSHLFRSRDGGGTWDDVDRGELPDVPHHALAIPTTAPDEVYVASDVGVFVSPDSGATWRRMPDGLPNVPVIDLVYHEATGALWAATYGRGVWRIQIR